MLSEYTLALIMVTSNINNTITFFTSQINIHQIFSHLITINYLMGESSDKHVARYLWCVIGLFKNIKCFSENEDDCTMCTTRKTLTICFLHNVTLHTKVLVSVL